MERKRHKYTLKDLAKALGISTSTASKAMNDSYEISLETKARVRAFAAEVGYSPDSIAKSLKEGKSKTIGVIVSSFDNVFVGQMLVGIQEACGQAGYGVLIMPSDESLLIERKNIDLLLSRGVDGLLISPSGASDLIADLEQLTNSKIPVVLFDRFLDNIDLCKVSSKNLEGAYMATTHLVANGYTRIAMLHSDAQLNINKERLNGYKQALADTGLPLMEDYVKPCNFQTKDLLKQSIRQAILDFRALPHPPDALFCSSDQLTILSLGIIREMGLAIPKDLAIIGFSNTEWAEDLNPSLSTIRQPAREMASLAARKLIHFIEKPREYDEDARQTILLDNVLHARLSSSSKGSSK